MKIPFHVLSFALLRTGSSVWSFVIIRFNQFSNQMSSQISFYLDFSVIFILYNINWAIDHHATSQPLRFFLKDIYAILSPLLHNLDKKKGLVFIFLHQTAIFVWGKQVESAVQIWPPGLTSTVIILAINIIFINILAININLAINIIFINWVEPILSSCPDLRSVTMKVGPRNRQPLASSSSTKKRQTKQAIIQPNNQTNDQTKRTKQTKFNINISINISMVGTVLIAGTGFVWTQRVHVWGCQ